MATVCEDSAGAAISAALELVRSTALDHAKAVEGAEAALVAAAERLAQQFAAFEALQAELNEERETVRLVGERQRSPVLLDVGGMHFKTSRMTLTAVPGSMLEAMFSGRNDALLETDADGRVFIDRDGSIFGHVLNFLRDPAWRGTLQTMGEAERQALRREAHYFGLEEAIFGNEASPPSQPALPRQLLCAGGHDNNSGLSDTEVLDLATMTFRPGQPMLSIRDDCSVCPLGPGRLLLAGGYGSDNALDTTEIFDCEAMTFSPGPRLNRRRDGCGMLSFGTGSLLVVGGYDGDRQNDTTEALDFSSMTFVPGPRLLTRRSHFAIVNLGAQGAIVVGGHDGENQLDTTELLDPEARSFTFGPRLLSRRAGLAAVLLDEHRLLVAGGHDGINALESTEILDLRTSTFARGPRMRARRWGCSAAVLDPGRVLVVGGHDGNGRLKTCDILILATMTFEPGGPCMSSPRDGFALGAF